MSQTKCEGKMSLDKNTALIFGVVVACIIYLLDRSMSRQKMHVIDCDADPFLCPGWCVVEHRKGGQMEWDPTKIAFYLSQDQKVGKTVVGTKLLEDLRSKSVMNANVLDYLLAHPELIPSKCRGKDTFFWGTIFRNRDGRPCVLCLGGKRRFLHFWYRGEWSSFQHGLDHGFSDICPALVNTNQ